VAKSITVGTSLFRRQIPYSGRGNSLFGTEQGIVRSALKSQRKGTSESAESAETAGDFGDFPVIFPVLSSPPGCA
jgi:hypothetical protein